jgi:MSHA type pilus biogenesis protein MshL
MPHFPSSQTSRRCVLLLLTLALTSCAQYRDDKIDPTGNLSRKDYRGLLDRPVAAEYAQKLDGPPIPELLAPNAAAPSSLPPRESSNADQSVLVSISVTDQVPLSQVLIELARKAKVNLELDPRVKGGVIFSAYNQPLPKVMERLADLAGFRYRLENNTLRVTPDEATTELYRLDALNLSRRTESEVAIATNVFDADVAGGSSGNSNRSGNAAGDNNSTARVKSLADADFWGELEKNIAGILATHTDSETATKASFSLNRQTGLLSVYGNGRQQRAVARFVQQTRRLARLQVLIDARILEVELKEQFRSGINWRTLFDKGFDAAARFGPAAVGGPFLSAATATDGVLTASYKLGDFSTILNLVREFGATRVLSAPRLTVMNNQTAVMKVARNEVYFTTSAQFPTTVTAGGVPISGTPVFTSTPRTVPVGLVMTVQPAINPDSEDITLTLRPTISRVVARVSDPSIGLNAARGNVTTPVDSQIPVLAVRELDSVLRLRSGEVGVMGGLMQDSSLNTDQGVPFFDELPIVGNLARSRDNDGNVSELVILLRATITDQTPPDEADRDLYHRYNKDPRPLVEPLPEPLPPATAADQAAVEPEPLAILPDESDVTKTAPSRKQGLVYKDGRFTLPQRVKQ